MQFLITYFYLQNACSDDNISENNNVDNIFAKELQTIFLNRSGTGRQLCAYAV